MPPDAPEVIGPLVIGPVAHGGHCVARWDGQVIFVRHGLPGETVSVRITERRSSYLRADVVTVWDAAPGRADPPCPISGVCGGCDWQHVALDVQRDLKTAVVAEQLEHLAGVAWDGHVRPAPSDVDGTGLGRRTRMRYVADADGHTALRVHRSHDLVAVPDGGCPVAHPDQPQVWDRTWTPGAEIAVSGRDGQAAVLVDGRVVEGQPTLVERARGLDYRVAADGFWQVHPDAPDVLVDRVLRGAGDLAGRRAFDLYCGVGLFAGALVAGGAQVWGVESSRSAIALARRNVPGARFTAGRVDAVLRRLPSRTDLVVLDPPRTGAGAAVVDQVASRRPGRIVYVACDPAALARDLARFDRLGYVAVEISAHDLFCMTHHVECVAVLEPV